MPFCRRVLDSRLRGNDGGGGRIAQMGRMPRALLSLCPHRLGPFYRNAEEEGAASGVLARIKG